MNPLLVQLLMAKLGNGASPDMNALMSQLIGANGADAMTPEILPREAQPIRAWEPQESPELLAEVQALRLRCDTAAAALGACSLCWGAETTCRVCRGRGRPGFAIPDKELFNELVVPAVRMVQAQRNSGGSGPRRTSVPPAEAAIESGQKIN